jgi:hypothetical protein
MSDYIKKLAEQAGFEFNDNDVARCDTENLERFAELVRAEEKPEWQKLYKDEIKEILSDGEEWTAFEFAQAVSDLLREKNK